MGNVPLERELLEQVLPSSPPEALHGHGWGRGPPWLAAGCPPVPGAIGQWFEKAAMGSGFRKCSGPLIFCM